MYRVATRVEGAVAPPSTPKENLLGHRPLIKLPRMASFYFYLWCAFILAVILSLPVVNMMEKSREKKNLPVPDPSSDEGEGIADDAVADEIVDEASEFGEPVPSGADDFSAFDEEFK